MLQYDYAKEFEPETYKQQPKQTGMSQRARIAVVIVGGLLLAGLLFAATAAVKGDVKTSVIVGRFNQTATDGCAGWEMKNGDWVSTYCPFSDPDKPYEVDVTPGLKIGDTVEYGTRGGQQFIKLKE